MFIKIMKSNITNLILLSLISFVVVNCKPTDNYTKSTLILNLTSWNLPDTAKLSTPFNLALHSQTDNSCTSKVQFVLDQVNDTIYQVYGKATYENRGESCLYLVVNKDSTISLTLNKKGKFRFYFLNNDTYKKDSITIIP